MAVAVGTFGAAAAGALVRFIWLVTNVVWFGKISIANVSLAGAAPGLLMVLVPTLGGLTIGLMARFGSEKIRGHGIPEALEAILIGGSRISLKVAILKPLSSAISIGTGGPFGAEGPIIMTGGALRVSLWSVLSLERGRAEDSARSGFGCWHDSHLRNADRRSAACHRAAPFRVETTQPYPRRRRRCRVNRLATSLVRYLAPVSVLCGARAHTLSSGHQRRLGYRVRTAIGVLDHRSLQGRGPVPAITHPLDVVAGFGRPDRRARRPL
jgi:hypothetical protein